MDITSMEVVGNYEYSKRDLIGHGAFAMVFKGRHRENKDQAVAIKCITKKNLAKSQNLLSKEIKILQELSKSGCNHENVVALLECKETTSFVYLVMEYCNGGDLADYLHAKGTLSEDTIRLFLRQTAAALRALSEKGIVHRDLKPQNILLCYADDRPNPQPSEITLKIADFGFARFLEEGVMAATLCGSPMYMAPEVIMSLRYDAKADLWSIGTMVYQCLTGKAPFQAQTPHQLRQFYEHNVNIQPNIPPDTSPELRDLLQRLLKRNPKDRIEFEEFFRHPFLRSKSETTSPVSVPRTRSICSISGSPTSKNFCASPLSGNIGSSPSAGSSPVLQFSHRGRPRSGSEDNYMHPLNIDKPAKPVACRPDSPTLDDYIVIPKEVPLDSSDGSTGSANVNGVFNDSLSESPRLLARRSHPINVGASGIRSATNSASHSSTASSGVGQPTSRSPSRTRTSDVVRNGLRTGQPAAAEFGLDRASPPSSGVHPGAGPVSNVSALVSLLPSSPPKGNTLVGTPPSLSSWRRVHSANNLGQITTPQATGGCKCTLTPVLGSPSEWPESSLLPGDDLGVGPNGRATALHAPFASSSHLHSNTCPANLAMVAYDADCAAESRQSVMRFDTKPGQVIYEAFPGALSSCVRNSYLSSATRRSPSHKSVVPFVLSGANVAPSFDSSGSSSGVMTATTGSPSSRQLCTNCSPNRMHLDGPVLFEAPPLVEETLMDPEHNETVRKLDFVLALAERVTSIAQSHGSPLSDSFVGSSTSATSSHLSTERQRRVDQLVLYVHALQLLAASLELARYEIRAGRLHPSAIVRNMLQIMNEYYQKCLSACKILKQHGAVLDAAESNCELSYMSASKLLYYFAIDSCQAAIRSEIMDNADESMQHYSDALIILHSLIHQASNNHDRQLLGRYVESVKRRMSTLSYAVAAQ